MGQSADSSQRLLLEAAHQLAIGRAHSAREALRSVGHAIGVTDRRQWPPEREVEALAANLALAPADSAARQQAWAADALAALEFLRPRRAKVEAMPWHLPFSQQPELILWLFEDDVEALLLELNERQLPARLVRRRLFPAAKPGQPALQIDCIAFLAGERPVTLLTLPASMRSNRYSWEAGGNAVELLSEAALEQIRVADGE
ncbi:hypothetical protein [Pseudomarimonas arenosa]|uniref:Uncharacterized protein n=1 Tax=Pseudomarimonas arenosa TaxID=2774145 RepID=A0AAW3ZFU9_9GAMM|nr:hypothetical protein [Pseudomarimonas arenosa]MBD8525018.1 hypothetical protein [Pseudomarimonas arenosa]